MAFAFLFAAVAPVPPPRPPQEWQYPFLMAALPLIGLLLACALVLYFVDRWRKRPPPKACESNDQMAHFRELYEKGGMTREEYDRVKGLLAGQLRQEMNAPAPAPPPSAPPTAT